MHKMPSLRLAKSTIVLFCTFLHAIHTHAKFNDQLSVATLTASCLGLKNPIPGIDPALGLQVHVSEVHEAGTFSIQSGSPPNDIKVPNLPQFCRFGASFNTSRISQVSFEVWLPIQDFSGRLAFVGNSGYSGAINYPDMGIPLSKYKFAVVSTDAGHKGSEIDGSFAIKNPESQYDFGYRAAHLSTVYSKAVVKQFYGQPAKKHYWIGCSSGGRQGLKEVQSFPEDFDGVLAGSCGASWSHLSGWMIESNLRNSVKSTGHLSPSDWKLIHKFTLSVCDGLDGVTDNIISNPFVCRPTFESLLCKAPKSLSAPGAQESVCLTEAQISVLDSIFKPWLDSNGEELLPSYSWGTEYFSEQLTPGFVFGPAPEFFKYQVLNFTAVDNNYQFTSQEIPKLVRLADQTDPGMIEAVNPNIRSFIQRGGKLLTYIGLADAFIPAAASIQYYDSVVKALGRDPRDSYRLFAVPGMGHCGSGPGAWQMGAASQRDISLNGTMQSSSFDSQHDIILALIEWTENGTPPEYIIGTKYFDDNHAKGVQFQRKLCPWPLVAKFVGSDQNSAESFTCQMK